MIDFSNCNKILSGEDRRTLMQRALYTQPYFYRMSIEVDTTVKNTEARAVLGINKDFYFTEAIANFGEVKIDTTSFFDVSLYTEWNDSLYHWVAGRKVPSGYVFQEARLSSAQGGAGSVFFVDRQFEFFPQLIKRNDRVHCEITNVSTNVASSVVEIVLKGFNVLNNVYVTPMETEQINDSFKRPVEWLIMKLLIDKVGQESYILQNDNKPRVIVGLGAMNSSADVADCTVQIRDIARRLRLTDEAIPLQHLMPRIGCVNDTHIYYLPIEYYFPPYSQLQFDVFHEPQVDFEEVEIAVLTRTV